MKNFILNSGMYLGNTLLSMEGIVFIFLLSIFIKYEESYFTKSRFICFSLTFTVHFQVRSFNRSISATMLFYPRDVFSDDDCKDVDLDSYQSLSDVYVYWTYVKVS